MQTGTSRCTDYCVALLVVRVHSLVLAPLALLLRHLQHHLLPAEEGEGEAALGGVAALGHPLPHIKHLLATGLSTKMCKSPFYGGRSLLLQSCR